MKTLQLVTLLLICTLVPALSNAADNTASKGDDGWAKVGFGKDSLFVPLADGIQPAAANESMDHGVYYATYFRKGEDFSNWTHMMVVAVYPNAPTDVAVPPARAVLDFQLKESRDNCPPENFTGAVEAESSGHYGQMTSCKFLESGKTTLVYEYSMAMMGTGQVFAVTRMARSVNASAAVQAPQATISAWHDDLNRSMLCGREDSKCGPQAK